MSEAFYHRGLTIEFHAEIPRLAVDGQQVPLPVGVDPAELSSSNTNRDILIEYARRYLDSSPDVIGRDCLRDRHVAVLKDGALRWNQWRRDHPEIRPLLYEADLHGLDLSGANLANANLIRANLARATLANVNFHEANLGGADLTHANLKQANFCRTDLYDTILSHANLESANLQGTQLAKTHFPGATLTNCRVYGLSAWDLEIDADTHQQDLVIVYEQTAGSGDGKREGRIVVDDLRLAQFIYLLLHNENIGHVIENVSRKAVLILGRFTPERKPVLDAIRERLRERQEYLPILFDFENPSQRDFDETVRVLAGLSRFVIADITNPSSSPLELQLTVPEYMIPFVPIIQSGEKPFSMFDGLRHKYWWVLDEVVYPSPAVLIRELDRTVIARALEMERRMIAERARPHTPINLTE